MGESISLAFIKNGTSFKPSHISEVKAGDVYYLVTDGTPDKQHHKATANAAQDSLGSWFVTGVLHLKGD